MKDYFYCYNKQLFEFLNKKRNIKYVTIAKNPTNDRLFSLFEINKTLQDAISEYKQIQ